VIGVAQTVPVRGDVAVNLDRHRHLARVAAGRGAEVVVFPELSLTGYELDLGDTLAFHAEDARLDPLRKLSRELSLILIAGAPARVEAQLCIGAFLLYPDGAIDLYTKHHLGAFPPGASVDGAVPPAEATWFRPGARNPLVRFGEHTAAVAVCADTGQPAHSARAAARGAGIYLASMFVIPSDYEGEAMNFEAIAQRHGMVVAMANHGGASGGLAAAGRSTIWSPTGEVLARLDPSGEGVAVAEETVAGWRGRVVPVSD